jgi:hypothetical protein
LTQCQQKKHTHKFMMIWQFKNHEKLEKDQQPNSKARKIKASLLPKLQWQVKKTSLDLLHDWSIIWYSNCLVYPLTKFSSFLEMQFEELHTKLNSWLIAYYCHHCNTNFSFKDFILADQNYLKSIQHVNSLSSKQVYS